jgi:hypothetical protein
MQFHELLKGLEIAHHSIHLGQSEQFSSVIMAPPKCVFIDEQKSRDQLRLQLSA